MWMNFLLWITSFRKIRQYWRKTQEKVWHGGKCSEEGWGGKYCTTTFVIQNTNHWESIRNKQQGRQESKFYPREFRYKSLYLKKISPQIFIWLFTLIFYSFILALHTLLTILILSVPVKNQFENKIRKWQGSYQFAYGRNSWYADNEEESHTQLKKKNKLKN